MKNSKPLKESWEEEFLPYCADLSQSKAEALRRFIRSAVEEAKEEARKEAVWEVLLEISSVLVTAPQFLGDKSQMAKVIGLKVDELRKHFGIADKGKGGDKNG